MTPKCPDCKKDQDDCRCLELARMDNDSEMSEEDFIHIYNKLLMPAYQTLVPFDIKLAMRLTYQFAYESAAKLKDVEIMELKKKLNEPRWDKFDEATWNEMEENLKMAVEALEYYSNEHNYSGGYYDTTSSDCEDKAKEALEKIKAK